MDKIQVMVYVELTCASRVIENLNGKQNISMMVGHRFRMFMTN